MGDFLAVVFNRHNSSIAVVQELIGSSGGDRVYGPYGFSSVRTFGRTFRFRFRFRRASRLNESRYARSRVFSMTPFSSPFFRIFVVDLRVQHMNRFSVVLNRCYLTTRTLGISPALASPLRGARARERLARSFPRKGKNFVGLDL